MRPKPCSRFSFDGMLRFEIPDTGQFSVRQTLQIEHRMFNLHDYYAVELS